MTQDHSSKLSFSIEESVWLNRGQEVDEIVSLSLDPEITVQEHGEYVLIRGGLKLTGEYRSTGNSSVTEGENESLSSQVAFRSIEEVTLNEDGTGEIRHHFPIDVTIPQERIRSLDDIYVIVDSFDYDLPERGCIQLTADISITGMSTGKLDRELTEEIVTSMEEDRNFHFEAYNEEREEAQEQAEIETETEVEAQFPTNDEITELVVEEGSTQENGQRPEEDETIVQFPTFEAAEPVIEDEVRTEVEEAVDVELGFSDEVEEVTESSEIKEVQSPAIAFGVVKERPKTETTQAVEQSETKNNTFSVSKSFSGERKRDTKKEVKQEQSQQQKTRNQAEEQNEENTVEEAKTPREENALYLTKMLTKGEGEQFKKLKLCIIRENETLETIASRYEITQSTLIRINRLDDSNVEEGQILYIPVTQ